MRANSHDKKLVKRTLDAIIFERPSPVREFRISVWIKDMIFLYQIIGYEYDCTAYIKSRGEENIKIEMPGFRARRWAVERIHSWINRIRRLLIRWEKKIENYLAMLYFACAWITFKAAGLFE